jgi:hypothetical protein
MFVPLFFCDGALSSVYQGRRTQANRAGQPKELVVLPKLTSMVIYQKLEPDRRGVVWKKSKQGLIMSLFSV